MKKLLNNKYICDITVCFSASLIFAVCFSFMAEAVRIGSFREATFWLLDHSRTFFIGAVALMLLIAGLIWAVRRVYIAFTVVGAIILLGSFANFYKTIYRGDPLLPIDFVIALDAAKVAGELYMPFTYPMWVFLALVVIGAVLLFVLKLRLSPSSSKRQALFNGAVALSCIPVLAAYLSLTVWNTALMSPIGVKVIPGDAAMSYKNSGFITGYLLYAGNLTPKKPKEYSEKSVLSAAEGLKTPKVSSYPDIFIVMLESYYHLDNYPNAVTDDITSNYRRLAKEGTFGYFMSDKYSGGTGDMEFGALTGFSTSFLPTGSIPYSQYVSKSETPSYPRFLKQLGYSTTAIHPYDRTIYKRDKAYPNMGFDEFISRESFSESDTQGIYISDKAAMDKIIETYETAREKGPVFIHTVTMQNHIPNKKGEYPKEYAVNAYYNGVPNELCEALVSVATGLRDEDAAIGYLTDYLRKQERPAVVLFFGDHQTSIGSYNGKELLDYVDTLKELPLEAQVLATHKVPYLMWANYETGNENKNGGLIPPYQLIAQLAGRYNLPRSAWFEYLYKSGEELPGTNLGYIISPTGGLEGKPSSNQSLILERQRMLQYDALLGKGYAASLF